MKNDPAHVATDAEIAKIEKLIAKEYKKAHKEVSQKLDDYLARFATKDEKWQEWVANGTKTKKEYAEWKKGQVMVGKRWEEMRDSLAQDYTNAAKIAMSICKEHAPGVYALNHNYATFEVEKGSLLDTSYSLYSKESVEYMYRNKPKLYHTYGKAVAKEIKEGKQYPWDRRRITSVLTQGLLQGDSIAGITKRLEQVTVGDHKAAIRNARTMMTGVQNAGRTDAYQRALDLGIPVKKQWLATLDMRTRHWHKELDGVAVENDEPFVNEIGKIMFPGDPNADAANVYNCRCTLIAQIKGFEIDTKNTDLRHNKHLGEMSYDDWLAEHKSISLPITLPEEKAAAIKGAWNAKYGKGGTIENPEHKHTAAEGKALMDQYDQEQFSTQYAGIWSNKIVTPADYPGMKKAVNDKKWNLDKQIEKAKTKGDAKALAKYQTQMDELLDFEKQGKKYLQAHPELSAQKVTKTPKVKQTAKPAKAAEKSNKQPSGASEPKPAPKPKKVTEKQAAKAVSEAQGKVDDLAKNKYDNIWKDPVTPKDYAEKKGAIAAKKKYLQDKYDEAVANGWSAKEDKFKKLLDDLADFEKKGKEYEAAKAELDAAKKVYKPFEDAKKAKLDAKKAAVQKDIDAVGSKSYDLTMMGVHGPGGYSDPIKISELSAADIKKLKKFKKEYAHWGPNDPDLQKIDSVLDDLKQLKKHQKALDKLEGNVVGSNASGTFAQDAYSAERKKNAKNFTDRHEADDLWRSDLDKMWDDLTEYEKYSVWKYTENSNPLNKPLSGYVDSWLRSSFRGLGKVPWGYEDNWRTLGSKFKRLFGKDSAGHVDHKRVIQNLTKAIDKTSLSHDAWFVRGSGKSGLAGWLEGGGFDFDQVMRMLERGDTDALRNMFKGQVAVNHAYTSTGIATGTGFDREVSYLIYAPKGTKAVYAEPTSFYGKTIGDDPYYRGGVEELYEVGHDKLGVGREAEMIFQRGTKYRITDIKKTSRGIQVEMEIIGQPDYFKTGLEETFNGGKTLHKF